MSSEAVNDNVDEKKRDFLAKAASAIGAIGAVYVAVPFMASMEPSERAQALGAPVEVDISNLQPGELVRVMWRGKPVWILKRTPDVLAALPKLDDQLRDPLSKESNQPAAIQNEERAIKPDVFVAIGICTHLGCSPLYRPEVAPPDLGKDWPGGFFCPCHGSRFDLAGRVFKGVPAPQNLEIPPYRYLSDNRLLIGESDEEKVG
jgi:ubiquinol-cytochrome c reductase iron-sulfur subunit